jgi:tyrosine-specific transport protein
MNFIKALAVLLGTIIGVGIFGLPFAASMAGFPVMLFYFLVMAVLVSWMHCIYAKIIIETKAVHRLPGYVGEYLGSFWKHFIFAIIFVGMIGSSIAYIIIGGEFLFNLLVPTFGGSPALYSLIFFLPSAFLVFRGIEMIANFELILLLALFAILGVLCFKAVPFVNLQNLRTINVSSFFFPYGVVLFSLWGSNIIPELREIVGKRGLMKVIISGVVISVLVYAVFAFFILGASGINTSKDAISGLEGFLGNGMVRLGFLFGIITCFTSLITLSLSFKKTLTCDFKVNKNIAWGVACFLPLAIFYLGVKKFIPVITFTGAVSLGLEAFILILLYREFLRRRGLRLNPFYYILALVFVVGATFEIVSIIW